MSNTKLSVVESLIPSEETPQKRGGDSNKGQGGVNG
jgi:hypothetical protein